MQKNNFLKNKSFRVTKKFCGVERQEIVEWKKK